MHCIVFSLRSVCLRNVVLIACEPSNLKALDPNLSPRHLRMSANVLVSIHEQCILAKASTPVWGLVLSAMPKLICLIFQVVEISSPFKECLLSSAYYCIV